MAIFDHKELRTARFLSRRYIVGAAIAVCALTVGGYFYWRFRAIGTLVPFLDTGQYCDGEILVRAKSPDEDILLIGPISNADGNRITLAGAEPVPSGSVYRFRAGAGRFEMSDLDEWRQATGAITFRHSDRDFSTKPVELDVQTGSLSVGRTPLRTAGAYTLDVDVSPDRKFVNVVSANAPRSKGSFFWFFGGGGYPRGPFYHETFERITGAKVGHTYTLRYPGKMVTLSYCWEAQGKYVVYHDGEGRFLWIVPGPNHPSSKAPLQHTSTGQQKQEKSDD